MGHAWLGLALHGPWLAAFVLCLAVPGRLAWIGAVPGCAWTAPGLDWGCAWMCLALPLLRPGQELGCAWVLLAVLSGVWLCLVGAAPGCAWGLPRLCWGCDWVCLAWPAWAALGARCAQLHVGHACAGMGLCLAAPGWAWTTSGCTKAMPGCALL